MLEKYVSPIDDIKVAVWMVTYNHEAYIAEAIESVLMQQASFKYHLFIGEDCSTDATGAICEDYANNYPDKITLLRNPTNLGPNKNALNIYNFCFNSGSHYIAMLEGDDYWTDHFKLQKQVDFLEAHPDFNICFHKVNIFNQKSNLIMQDDITRDVQSTTTSIDLARGNYIHTASVLFRNNFILPKWFSKTTLGDWSLYMIAVNDKKIKKLSDIMAVYRIHDKGIWAEKLYVDRLNQTIQAYSMVLKKLQVSITTQIELQKTIRNYNSQLLKKEQSFIIRLKKIFFNG